MLRGHIFGVFVAEDVENEIEGEQDCRPPEDPSPALGVGTVAGCNGSQKCADIDHNNELKVIDKTVSISQAQASCLKLDGTYYAISGSSLMNEEQIRYCLKKSERLAGRQKSKHRSHTIWQIVSAILPARPERMLAPKRSPAVYILACQIAVARLTAMLNR